jgi:GGDEF domain-containing protein
MFKKLIEKLYLRQEGNLAFYDELTGVKNRVYYNYVAKHKYLQSECIVVFVDVDGLKFVNDTFGHSAGDDLICSVAWQLQSLGADEVIRYGGDEFIMIFAKESKKFSNLSQKIRGASYGVYKKGIHEDMSSAIKKADTSMYRLKTKKKQFQTVDNSMNKIKSYFNSNTETEKKQDGNC